MKKKIKDLTISDIRKYCDNTECKNCIFWDVHDVCQIDFIRYHGDDEFEEEIEIVEDCCHLDNKYKKDGAC